MPLSVHVAPGESVPQVKPDRTGYPIYDTGLIDEFYNLRKQVTADRAQHADMDEACHYTSTKARETAGEDERPTCADSDMDDTEEDD